MIDFINKLFSQAKTEKDPVCGMTVDPKETTYYSVFQNKHFYFCSESCKKQFDEKPQDFAHKFC
jgi:Cu+-exporting ATPase